jgi:predicted alpha/beta-fold hydrolase
MRLLDFKPSWGMESSHIQTITAGYAQGGAEPPSIPYYVDIGRGDKLACLVSLPPDWDKEIIVMLHGLGGHQSSSYMVRLSRKLYAIKKMAVRMNMR